MDNFFRRKVAILQEINLFRKIVIVFLEQEEFIVFIVKMFHYSEIFLLENNGSFKLLEIKFGRVYSPISFLENIFT